MPTKKPLRPSDFVSVVDTAPLPIPGREWGAPSFDIPRVDVRPQPTAAVHRTFDCDFSLTERVRTVPPPADAPMEEQEAYAESPFSVVPIAQLSCGLSMDPMTVQQAARDPRFLEQHLNAIFGQLKQKVLEQFADYMYSTRHGTRGMNPYEFNPYETEVERAKRFYETSNERKDETAASGGSGTIPKRIGKGTST